MLWAAWHLIKAVFARGYSPIGGGWLQLCSCLMKLHGTGVHSCAAVPRQQVQQKFR